MLKIFLILLAGILAGYLMRSVPQVKNIGKIITLFVFLLLFFLGINLGKNPEIINNFLKIGLQASIITLGALTGSILLSWAVYLRFFKK